MRRLVLSFAFAAASVWMPSPGITAADAVSGQTARSAPCSIFVGRVVPLGQAGTRYAIALMTHDGSRTAAGTLALYHGDDRYDVRFADARATDPREADSTPAPIVVDFPSPVPVEAAIVTELDGSACEPAYEPWRTGMTGATGLIGSLTTGTRAYSLRGAPPANEAMWSRFRAAAETARSVGPQPAVHEARPRCALPMRAATTIQPVEPDFPRAALGRYKSASADVLVTLADTGAVAATRVERSSGYPEADRSALDAAAGARFSPAVFRCRSYAGSYIFEVRFVN
jgi:TonB family protein